VASPVSGFSFWTKDQGDWAGSLVLRGQSPGLSRQRRIAYTYDHGVPQIDHQLPKKPADKLKKKRGKNLKAKASS
jgi:hypothetical protein